MSDFERDPDGRWPQAERRRTARRAVRERRAAAEPGGEDTRKGSDRRTGQRRVAGDRRDESGWLTLTLQATPVGEAGSEGDLLSAAAAARQFAQARYSNFKVGAALETADGTLVRGCNIENATYGLTLCAERVALVKAVSEGHSGFTRIAVVADTAAPTPPCGACRQLLWEYCGDIEVILGNLEAVTERHRLAALLPRPFDRGLLE